MAAVDRGVPYWTIGCPVFLRFYWIHVGPPRRRRRLEVRAFSSTDPPIVLHTMEYEPSRGSLVGELCFPIATNRYRRPPGHVHRSVRQTSHKVNANYLSAVCGNYDQLNVESSSRAKARRSEPTFRRRARGPRSRKFLAFPARVKLPACPLMIPKLRLAKLSAEIHVLSDQDLVAQTFCCFVCYRRGNIFN